MPDTVDAGTSTAAAEAPSVARTTDGACVGDGNIPYIKGTRDAGGGLYIQSVTSFLWFTNHLLHLLNSLQRYIFPRNFMALK